MLQSSLPVLFCDTGFTDRQPERLPAGAGEKVGKGAGEIVVRPPAHFPTCPPATEFGSGGGSCTHLTEFMRLRSVLWSSSPQCKRGLRNAERGIGAILHRAPSRCSAFRVPSSEFENGGVRRVTLPLSTACKAGASLFSHGPMLR